jgi:hypothetical protein
VTRQALLVLGMHRSGTSAFTGLLIQLGAQGPRTLMQPDEHNPLGFWESDAFCAFHERLLHAAGTAWDGWTRFTPNDLGTETAAQFADGFRALLQREFGDAPLFVVKDPRICRFVPFWLRNLAEADITPAAIITVRSPLEVAQSLAARNGFLLEQSLLLWLRHMLDAEFETRTINRSVVRYRDLLEDWRTVTDKISTDINVAWPSESAATDMEIADFLKPELCHHAIGLEALDVSPPLSRWVRQTCEAFELLLEPQAPRIHDAFDALDNIRREFDGVTCVFGPLLDRQRHELGRHAARIEADRDHLRQHAARVEADRDHLRQHAARVEADRDLLRQHAAGLEADRDHLREHASNLEAARDQLHERASTLARELARTKQQLDAQIESLSHRLETSENDVRALRGSRTWRWTAPFRTAVSALLYARARVVDSWRNGGVRP